MTIGRFFVASFLYIPSILLSQELDSLKSVPTDNMTTSEKVDHLIRIADEVINDPSDEFDSYIDTIGSIIQLDIQSKQTGKVSLLKGIRYFRFGKLEEAEESLTKAIDILKKTEEKLDFAKANHFLASTYANQDDYYTSIQYYEKARSIYDDLADEEWLTKVYANMGWSYRERGDIDKAMEVYMKALVIAEKNKSLSGLFDVYHELGYIYIEQGDTAEAEKTFLKTLDVAQQMESKERISYANGDLAILFFKKKDYNESLKYNKKDLRMQLELGNNRDLPMIYNNISDCFFELKNYDSTIYYAEKALAVDIDQRSTYENAQSKINIGKAKAVNKEYLTAEKLLEEALNAGNAINSIDVKRNALNQLYLLSRDRGNFESALQYFEQYKALQDSIFNLETNRQIEEAKAVFELDKSKQQIVNLDLEKQNAETKRNLYLVAFILMAIIGVILFLYNRLIRIKNGMILRRNKKIADAKLDKAKSELELYTKMLADKNKLIKKLNNEYSKVKGEIKMLAPDSSKKIKKLIKSTLLTDNEWEEFKERFDQIYPSFFIQLRGKYPGLTTTEEKLFALSKLNLKNKEIGSMLGVSPSSVTKSKYRLGKKLDVVPDQISEIAASI